MKNAYMLDGELIDWYGSDDGKETSDEVMFKVNYVNDEYDDCEFFTNLEDAEVFAENLQDEGYTTEIMRAA